MYHRLPACIERPREGSSQGKTLRALGEKHPVLRVGSAEGAWEIESVDLRFY